MEETIQNKSESHQVAFAISANSEQITEQNQRFALQELLKQFLAMSRYITAISYQLKTNCGKAIAIVP